MTVARRYPDEPAGPFVSPPESFVDRSGRSIEIYSLRGVPAGERDALLDALADMYDRFDPADRAQSIPPTGRERVEAWLASLDRAAVVNVLAVHGDVVAGHATLVPDREGAFELAIFVHQDYQRAGIGGRLVRHLLGEGADRGVARVWLTVERWNDAAIALYRDVGFEMSDDAGFTMEMTLRLA